MFKPLIVSLLASTLLTLLVAAPVVRAQAPFQLAQSSTAPLAEGLEHLKDYNYPAVWAMLTRESQADLVRFLALWPDWREMPHEELQALLINDDHHLHRQAWSLLREKLQWPEQFTLPHFKAIYEDGQKKLEWWTAKYVIRSRGDIHTYTLKYENLPVDTYQVYPSPGNHLLEGCWAGKPVPIGGEGTLEAFWAVAFYKQIAPNTFINENTTMYEHPVYESEFKGYFTGIHTRLEYVRLNGKKSSYGHTELDIFGSKEKFERKQVEAVTSFQIKDKNNLLLFGPWGNVRHKLVRCGPKTIEAVFACRDMGQIGRPCDISLYGPTIEGPKKITQVHDREPLVGYHESPGSNYQP